MNILVSACLLGVNCRYDGKCQKIESFESQLGWLMEKFHLIPVCPEIYGGLTTPRPPAEIVGNAVVTQAGEDVTQAFQKGAEEVLHLANLYHCQYAILKQGSPSCGGQKIYDGTFTGTKIDGSGVTARLLSEHGITVLSELDFAQYLQNINNNQERKY